MKKHNITKTELLRVAREQQLITASNKAHLLITLSVLNDVFEFTSDDLNCFIDCYETLLKSYDDDREDIYNLSDHINEICGIKIL